MDRRFLRSGHAAIVSMYITLIRQTIPFHKALIHSYKTCSIQRSFYNYGNKQIIQTGGVIYSRLTAYHGSAFNIDNRAVFVFISVGA